MTDLQVKYQSLQHEKDKLAEEKRIHDAQISELTQRGAKEAAEVDKILAETRITNKDLEWYDTRAMDQHGNMIADSASKWITSSAKLIDAVIPF